MSVRKKLLGASLALVLPAGAASAMEEITVGYFLEWPTPNLYAQAEGIYDETLGVRVNWRAFETGVAMSAAMAGGAVQIAFSQGVPPFVVATSAGLELQLTGIATTYDDYDNCVVHAGTGISAGNAQELEGERVAVPLGTAAHYGMLRQMEHFGINTANLSIVDLAPADGAAALSRGDVAMACGWGGGLQRMLEYGDVLLTGAEKRELGIRIFDVVSVESNFAAENPEIVAGFLRVTEDMNRRFETDREAMTPVIAGAAGMEPEAAETGLGLFVFPTLEEQLGPEWMGRDLADFLKEVADFFVAQGTMESALDSYEGVINTSFMEMARDM